MHVVLANLIDKPSSGSQFPLTHLSDASLIKPYCSQGWKWACWSRGACKSDWEMQRHHSNCLGFQYLQYHSAAARALSRVVGVTPTTVQLQQRAAKARRGAGEVTGAIGDREDREGSEKQEWPLRRCERKPQYSLWWRQLSAAGLRPEFIHCWVLLLFFLHANTQLIFLLTCLGHTQI